MNKQLVNQTQKKTSILKSTGIYAASNFVTMFLRIVGGILTSRCVEPMVLGAYNGIGLVGGYIPFFQLGVFSGLNRDLPVSLGAGDHEQSRNLTAVAQFWALFISFSIAACMSAIAIWYAIQGDFHTAAGWLSHAINIFGIVFVTSFLETLLKASSNFTTLAGIRLIRMASSVVFVALVYWFNWYGLCLRGALIALVGLTLMWVKRPIKVKPSFDYKVMTQLVKTGIPIFIVGYIFSLWTILNSTMVLTFIGKEGLGLYHVANLVGPAMILMTRALGQVIYPRLAADFGRGKKIKELVRMSLLPIVLGVLFTAFGAIIGWFLLPYAVEYILPKYKEGIAAAQWAVVASTVLAFGPLNNIFNVLKKQGRYGVAMIIGMAVYLVALLVFKQDGIELTDFPKALLIGRAAFMLITYSMVFHMMKQEARELKHA